MKYEIMKTMKIDGIDVVVDNSGNIYADGCYCKPYTNSKTGYVSVYLNKRSYYVHRLVCMAFHPKKDCQSYADYSEWQVDHVDNNRQHNVPYNLRFVSRDFNNGRRHARMMKSKNGKHTNHTHQIVKAERDGEIRYFLNGNQCAEGLGCTRPHVYMVLDGQCDSVFGWKLTFVPRSSEEAKECVARHNEKKEQKRQIKQNRIMEHRSKVKEGRLNVVKKVAELFCDLYDTGHKLDEIDERVRQMKRDMQAVVRCDKDGNVLEEWSSVFRCQVETGIGVIRNLVQSGNEGGEYNGYIFRYKCPRY